MASIRFDVISIGTLSRNRLWNEQQPLRTPHATTTLIRTPKHHILVDPGLPAPALAAHLFERTGLTPDKIDTVFLTNFRPAHRAGLDLFDRSRIFIHEVEQQAAAQHLDSLLASAPAEDLDRKLIDRERRLLDKLQVAPDELDENVDLFPLFGYTPGGCGLLLALPTVTTLIAGDAVPTQDHFLAGQVLPDAYDLQAAQDSLREVYEIADFIVPGHDNLFANPRIYGI
ncbi:MAG TPA: MBL fold metallo-hydrolase [Tepidisphaeraceae bacterium]|nr:MBL fold metallo-hydrolase [Tepidisphaeraceae bacterium]